MRPLTSFKPDPLIRSTVSNPPLLCGIQTVAVQHGRRAVAAPNTLTLRLMSTTAEKVVDVHQEIADVTQKWMNTVTSGEF